MLLMLSAFSLAAPPTPSAPGDGPAPTPVATSAPVPSPGPGSPDASAWPKDKGALETMLPDASLGDSSPLVDPLGDGAYGTTWTLTKPGVIAGVHCTKHLEITDSSWGCTLAEPLALVKPQVTLKAGSEVSFDYGTARPSVFQVADVVPAIPRVVIDGYPCRGEVVLAEGRFAKCELAADHAVGALVLAAGSIVEKTMFGTFQILPMKPVSVPGGPEIPAETWFTLDEKGAVQVFEDGMGD